MVDITLPAPLRSATNSRVALGAEQQEPGLAALRGQSQIQSENAWGLG
jgi:hypothetical protein